MKARITYCKLGKIRFTGHRDVARIWERTLRKAAVPVAMSTGFTPRARMAFGLALPTGAESVGELLDVTFDEAAGVTAADLAAIAERIDASLPTGMAVTGIRECGSAEVSLQEDVVATTWAMVVDSPDVEAAMSRVMNANELWLERERKGEKRRDDVRPGILGLAPLHEQRVLPQHWPDESRGTLIEAVLTTAGRGIRPTELIEVLVPGCEPWNHLTRVLRINQLIERNGELSDVLDLRAAHPQVCA
ncbi:MAG: TIGR03936 family radical SAM-associated protein [Acidimicrobiia bacterium]